MSSSRFETLKMSLAFLLLCFFALGSHALTYHGADITSVPLVESQGHSYSDGGKVAPFETILKSHGLNTARIRVWTAGQYSLSYGLSYAKRVKAAGLTLIVDLHLSDTCRSQIVSPSFLFTHIRSGADPGHQSIPSAWPKTLSGLNTQIFKQVISNLEMSSS